ncbi:hypothetical protein D3C84_791190 [compost metagenome]
MLTHRHIERRSRLVSDDHFRVGDHHHGDHDALAHAAADLMRVEVVDALGIADVDLFEHQQNPVAGFAAAGLVVRQVGLGDLIADLDHRVERVLGVLHDHRDALATDLLHGLFAGAEQVNLAELHGLGGNLRARRVQLEQAASDGGFARAGLADDGELFAAQGERYIAHRVHFFLAVDEAHIERIDIEFERRHKASSYSLRGSRMSRRPSPNRLNARLTSMIAAPGTATSHQHSSM